MSVAVLSKKDQKKSLSGLKRKKKLQKNILTSPDNMRIKNLQVDNKYIVAITSILERLLPGAKLPENQTKQCDRSKTEISENRLKRNQLLLGINVVSKGVNNKTAECVLLADDINPKLLITHLILLCSLKSVPYLYMPNLRELTKKTLGFPCIVLGFKKNSIDFMPAMKEICSAVMNKKSDMECHIEENEKSEIQSKIDDTNIKKSSNFKYLYRDLEMKNKRVFVPDLCSEDSENKKFDFIAIESDDDEIDSSKKFQNKNVLHTKHLTEPRERKVNNHTEADVTNKTVKYSVARVMKMGANPKREKKKFQKLKKNKKLTS